MGKKITVVLVGLDELYCLFVCSVERRSAVRDL